MSYPLSPNSLGANVPLVNPTAQTHDVAIPVAPAQDSSNICHPLLVDGAGRLEVSVTGAGSGGTSAVDQSAFTAGVTAGTPAMAYDSGTGESVVLAVSPNTRALLVSGSFASTPVQSNTASVVAQTTVGTTSVQILAANAARKRVRVQNSGTTVIKLGFGRTPTQTAYHRALPAGGSADDGSSPPLEDMTWTGAINAISSTVGGTCVVEEDT